MVASAKKLKSGNILKKQQPKNELKAAIDNISFWQLAKGSQLGVEYSSSNGGPSPPIPSAAGIWSWLYASLLQVSTHNRVDAKVSGQLKINTVIRIPQVAKWKLCLAYVIYVFHDGICRKSFLLSSEVLGFQYLSPFMY